MNDLVVAKAVRAQSVLYQQLVSPTVNDGIVVAVTIGFEYEPPVQEQVYLPLAAAA